MGSDCLSPRPNILTSVSTKKVKQPLSVTHPELAKEADGWDPSAVFAGTHSKLNWKCTKGHIWIAAVQDRSRRGDGCPICVGKKVLIGYNDLATLNPDVASEADGWDPKTVTIGSSRKFQWICPKGHTWVASVVSRTNGSKCSVCKGRQTQVGFNDLESFFPKIAQEADGWDPKTVTPGSGKKLGWKCEFGHKWKAIVHSRTSRNLGCPYCSNQSVLIGYNDFATTHPELLDQLVNSDGTDFVAGSTSKTLEWKCNLGHQFKMKPQERTVRGYGCPICSGRQVLAGFNDLKTTHPNIAVEAYGFDPETLTAGSNTKVNWKCSSGHIYKASPHQRTGLSSGCAVCSGDQINIGVNDLETTDPDIALEAFDWDPKTVTRSSNKKRVWKCRFGHIWTTSVNSRTNMKSGCPVCDGRGLLSGFNDLLTRFPDVAAEADGWDPALVLSGTHKKYKWICAEGHKWSAPIKDRTSRGDGCPSCAKFGFDNNKVAWIYFLEHETWGLFQIGITNHLKNRLNDHKRLGWEVVEISDPMEGFLAKEWEKSILDFLTGSGIELGNPKIAGTYSGYTETWYQRDLPVKSIKELMRLTEEFERDV
jgi:hypothetical protein